MPINFENLRFHEIHIHRIKEGWNIRIDYFLTMITDLENCKVHFRLYYVIKDRLTKQSYEGGAPKFPKLTYKN